ncbi:MAG: apolipoprotein N-acyltransferase [Alphaproteobacteria bacterium]|nr:apolipoprotein N-acyltransferase [Alphaproteobacteria bacterium]
MGEAAPATGFDSFGWALRVRRACEALGGCRRWLLAFLLGVLAAFAMPPWHGAPLLFLAFPGLFWLIGATRRHRTACLLGLAFGFGHFLVGVYWITNAFLVDADRFAWLVPIAIPGLALYLALFPAGCVLAFRLLGRFLGGDGWRGALLFALLWTGFEWLRGHLLTGFPWTLMGHGWVVSEAMMQTAAVVGSYGLSFLMVLAALMPVVLARPQSKGRLLPLGLTIGLLLLLWGGGALRLERAGAPEETGVQLRLVQANIPQTLKWRSDLHEAHFARHLSLTTGPGFDKANIVVWPEMAVPYALAGDAKRRARLRAAVPAGGVLLTGAPRLAQANAPRSASNGLVVLDDQGEIVGGYDKFHLVPFGEYVPLRKWLPISRIVPGIGDFHRGPGPRTLALPGLPAPSPLICYEVIFPGRVLDATTRPGWLLNVTNDAWFGESSGPYQHFASARFRAVEEGLPLVRAANTGISAIVDAHGRVRARLDLGETGALDGPLPGALAPPPYARFGDGVLFGLLGAGLILLGTARLWGWSTTSHG